MASNVLTRVKPCCVLQAPRGLCHEAIADPAKTYRFILFMYEYIYKSNNAPLAPEIDGSIKFKPGVEKSFSFITTDAEGHDVQYYIDWGDYHYTEWEGTFSSGEIAIFNHTWEEEGEYTIKAKARDILSAESDWSEYEVLVTSTKSTHNTFYQYLFKKLQNNFPMLKYVLKMVYHQF